MDRFTLNDGTICQMIFTCVIDNVSYMIYKELHRPDYYVTKYAILNNHFALLDLSNDEIKQVNTKYQEYLKGVFDDE